MVSLKHISTLATFNQTKFSADSTDSSYFLGSDQTQIFQGTPDVKYNDLCYIKCSNLQYTHGHLYGSTEVGEAHVSLTQEEYDTLSEEEKNNGKIYLIKDVINPDDLTVSGDATIGGDVTINGSLTVGNSIITDIDDSIKPNSNNPVKNSAIYNLIQNPIHCYYDANTSHGDISNRAKAIQDVLNDIMPKSNASGDIKFAVIRHANGFAFLALIAQHGDNCLIVEFGFHSDDLITYISTLENGTWGTVSQRKTY